MHAETTNITFTVQQHVLHDDMVYVTVSCANKAGLTSHLRSDGVKIVTSSPSTDNVIVEVLSSSSTQYSVQDGFHGDASYISFRWTGFENDDGIDTFLVCICVSLHSNTFK